jgi:dTDP-4-amino-4,6-dideoxygalactose transaminase
MSVAHIPYNRPYTTGHEFGYIRAAIANGHLSGNGPFVARCASWLESRIGSARVLLTHSCTGALELAMTLADVGPGDEVIVPSFTFVSTANAVVGRGATPVFVDISADTLNVDPDHALDAVTERTRAIVPVHYAGIAASLDAVAEVAEEEDLLVVEDAAQGFGATYRGRPLGALGHLGVMSFHETKNVHCGEGGALLVNSARFADRAEVVQEKGTNRQRFFRGQVDKYTWVDVGSSYLLSEINAAFLWAQLRQSAEITAARLAIWDAYHAAFAALEERGLLRRPVVPPDVTHNGHIYYVLLEDATARDGFIAAMARAGIHCVFHYVPLHSSPAGRRFGRAHGNLTVTDDVSERLVRMPLWIGMSEADVSRVVEAASVAVQQVARARG